MRSSLVLRNENIPVVHQEHAYDDAYVALTTALPWVHELGWPPRHCDPTTVRLAAGPRTIDTWLQPAALGYQLLEVAFFFDQSDGYYA